MILSRGSRQRRTPGSLVRAGIRVFQARVCLATALLMSAACADSVIRPLAIDPAVDSSWLVGDALASFDLARGQFRLNHAWRYISPALAESLSVSSARSIGTPGPFNGFIAVLERDRGAPINFASLRACGRTHYVESPFGLLDQPLPQQARRAFGNNWAVTLCSGSDAQLAVSLSDDSLTRSMTGDLNDLVRSGDVSAYLAFGIPSRYTPDGPLSAESAVGFVWRSTEHRIAQAPEAYNAYDERMVGQLAGCASWRIVLERPVLLTSLRSGQLIKTDTLYVMSLPACFSDSPTLLAALPEQPSTRWLRLFNGDSVSVPLRGPIVFDRVAIAP